MSAPETGSEDRPAPSPDSLEQMVSALTRAIPDLNWDLFALSGRVISLAHRFEDISADSLAHLGLNRAEGNVLGILRSRSEDTPSRLAKLVHQSPAGMTRTLDRLERQHLIVREADAENLRQIRIRLTEKGREIGEQKLRLQAQAISAALGDVAPETIEQLADTLKGLDSRLRSEFDAQRKASRVA